MTDPSPKVEVITSVQRRRRWSAAEKVRMVEETYAPGASVSSVARQHGVNPNQIFSWRRLAAEGAYTAAAAGEEVVPASEHRALQQQVRELHRLLGKKTLEAEILKEALQQVEPKKAAAARTLAAAGRFPVKAVAETLGVARSGLAASTRAAPPGRRGRPPMPEGDLLRRIRDLITELPTYGYRRVHALLRQQAELEDWPPPNHKRVWRVMKAHGLLLTRHAGGVEHRHDGRVAVEARNTRWCSDGFEIACDNGERVRVAFTLDCCDREAITYVGTTGGITSEHVRDMMVEAVGRRFGLVNRLPRPVEWLSDNGSCYVARETRRFASSIGMLPRTTPLQSPQSNGMAEAFVRTFKRDYARVRPCPDAQTVLQSLPIWFTHYNEIHPHSALGYRSLRQFIRATLTA
jgi:transposase InsO family protein/transposase-like protein